MNDENAADALPLKGRVPAVLLLVFCCWHAVFLVISIVPQRPGQEDRGTLPMNLYGQLAAGNQGWKMFETIPLLHSLDARIEIEDGAGGRKTVGSVLPGFAPYPKPELSRHYILLHRLLLSSSSPSQLEAYLRRVDDHLSALRGPAVRGHWSLVIDAEYTRTLIYSRRDGELYVFATRSFTPAKPGGVAP